ncbi:MAG: glycine cleavage system protein GcvH [Deltaproteobacteria bacterium]|jgi:glycine cleavage system H protein|nr:glycine cleavage system protein GcvH [Deltaproteobacteria bacterium]
MEFPEDIKYIATHQWVKPEGKTGTVGITDYAQDQLGEVVLVELPDVGSSVQKGAVFGTIESVKAVADLYSPVDGTVTEVNEAVYDEPNLVNEDPYGKGWMLKVEMSDPGQPDSLLSASDYQATLKEE